MIKSIMPLELQHTGLQYSIDQAKANFDRNKELSKILEKIQEKCSTEINGLLGSKAKEYMEFREKSRKAAKTIQPLFTATPEGRKIKKQFQKTSLSEANEFIKGLGINPKDIKLILSKYQEESKSVIENTRAVAGSLEFDTGTIPPDVVNPNPGSPWQSFRPPYHYSDGEPYASHSGSASNFEPRVIHYENHLTGEISCHSQNFIHNGGDYATEVTAVTSFILVYYQMPASGRLSIWTQLQCVESSYLGLLTNYIGSSDAAISQSSSYYMSLVEPLVEPLGIKEAYFQLLSYGRYTDDDAEWSGNMAMPGEYKTFNLISDVSYPVGQWILIKTGLFDYQDAVVNDMGFVGEIKNRWMTNGIFISVVNP
jgi:hypothetical protein